MKTEIRYFDTGPLPFFFGVCFSEAAFKRELGRFSIPHNTPWCPKDGATDAFTNSDTGALVVIVSIRPVSKSTGLPGLAAHEASHALHFLLDHMGESKMGDETQAYTLQWMVDRIIEAHDVHTKKARRKVSKAKR